MRCHIIKSQADDTFLPINAVFKWLNKKRSWLLQNVPIYVDG